MSLPTAGVTIEEISPVKKKLLFEVQWSDVKRELDAAYDTVSKTARIKGFRPGKTPRKILEIHYKEQAENEAITNIITRYYARALEDNKIHAIDHPLIDQHGIKPESNFTFTVTVETQPEFEPRDYTDIEVEKEVVEITDHDVEQRLQQLREMMARLEEVREDRGIEKGDFVLLDYEVSVGGEKQKDMSQKDYMFQVGSGRLIPGFEDKMVGLRKGETKDISVPFPEQYDSEQLAGKEGTFTVTIKDIRHKVLPEIDDTFLRNFQRFETFDDLKKDIRRSLTDEDNNRVESAVRNQLIEKILERNQFEVPSAWVDRQIYYMMLDARQRMIMNGMKPEKASEIAQSARERFRDQAVKMVKSSVLLSKIAQKEALVVDDRDVEEELKNEAIRYGRDYESVKKMYAEGDSLMKLKEELLERKALQHIEQKAIVKAIGKTSGEKTYGGTSE